MRRVNPYEVGKELDNYFIHLARFMFCARQISKEMSVLEVGCGTGYGSRLLSDYAKEVYATDQALELYDTWDKYNKNNLFFIKSLDDISRKFDVVVSFEVIEHIKLNDVDAFLNTLKSYLKPQGVIYLSTPRALPFEERGLNRQIEHDHEFEPDEFKNLLNKHFSNVFLFGQNDSIIGSQNISMAWNMVAICIP